MTQPPRDESPPPDPNTSGAPTSPSDSDAVSGGTQPLPPPQGMPPPQQPGPPQQPMPPPGQPYSSAAQFPSAPAPPAGYGYGTVSPASVPPGLYPDSQSGLLLPDGTQLASIGRRIGSWFLGILLAIVTLGIGYLIWGLLVWGRGQTPAKQVLGMRAWRPETHRVATFWWMALREVIGGLAEGILSFVTYLLSFILMVAGRERRCLKDYVAGTVILHDPNRKLAGER